MRMAATEAHQSLQCSPKTAYGGGAWPCQTAAHGVFRHKILALVYHNIVFGFALKIPRFDDPPAPRPQLCLRYPRCLQRLLTTSTASGCALCAHCMHQRRTRSRGSPNATPRAPVKTLQSSHCCSDKPSCVCRHGDRQGPGGTGRQARKALKKL